MPKKTPKRGDHRPPRVLPTCDLMEARVLLSGSVALTAKAPIAHMRPTFVSYSSNPKASIASRVDKFAAGSSTAGGITPAQMRSAYGLGAYGSSNITFNGIQGDGTGQTIAIIDAFNDPDITGDLSAFDSHFGLPNPPNFQVLNESGQTSPLPSNSPFSGSNEGWSIEESLDVEWAHVMAPGANIILFEANGSGSDLYTAAITAAKTAGVSVASMSWGGSESSGETSTDSDFVAPATHAGVTFFASTGDTGAEVSYPAESPNVVAVGGTTLIQSGGTHISESAWSDGGGGSSMYEPQPSYQVGVITSTKRRTPDVSIDADPNSGVPIYDSYDEGTGTPWAVYGGTSLASPMWAGLVAVADQGRIAEGLTTLSSKQTLTRLYQLSPANFHDITSGSNGHAAAVGYDEATGIGTPIANLLVPDLAGSATITGRVFVDNSGNGIYGGSDTPMAGMTVYLDLNNNGKLDASEPTTTTNAQGIYTFTDQPAGGTVRLSSPVVTGYVAVPALASITYGSTDTDNFTYFPAPISSTVPATKYTVQTDATGTEDQVLINGTLGYSVAKSSLASSPLSFSLTGAGDSFTINGANGNPVPSGGISLNGPASGMSLSVIGTATGNDSFTVTTTSISFDSNPVTFSNVSLLTLNPGTGTDALAVNSGSVTIAPQTPGDGILTRNFSSISIASGASALFATAPLHTDRMLVETATLSFLGKLDLGGNDMIIHDGNLAAITALLAGGYANGQWNGTGIASTAANADTTHLTALGAIQNTLYGGIGQPAFDGTSPLTTDVLIKYTYYGDTNLDGTVDGSDYSRIDNTTLLGGTGWANGDFNYDNSIDGSDYTLIDNAFNTQGSPL